MVIVLGFFSERAVSCKGAPSPVGLLYCSLGLWTPGMCANGLDLDICQSKPDNYDWKSMGEIKLLEDDRSGLSADDLDPEELLKAKRWIAKAGWGFTLLIVVIWPVLSTPAGVFTKDYFAFWVFISVRKSNSE